MLTTARILFLLVAFPVVIAGVLFFISVEPEPVVQLDWSLTKHDINRAKKILNEASELTGSSSLQTIELTEKDINIAANYLLNRHINSDTEVKLRDNALKVQITLPLPEQQLKQFLNIHFDLLIESDNPRIENFTVGPLFIPDEYSGQLILKLIQNTPLKRYDILVRQHFKSIRVTPQQLAITYYPTTGALAGTQNLLSNDINSHALVVYQHKLDQIVQNHDRGWLLSLADLLQPMFLLAFQRSTLENAIDENRAVIFVVNSYINRKSLQHFLPVKTELPNPQHLEVYMYKRSDLSRHFIGSAVLTASASSYLSDLVGLKKEMIDAQQGSGFSFIDLAADRAGTHFGKIATSSPENARTIQKTMSKTSDYREFMPNALDLPENLSDRAFNEQFGSVNSSDYQKMVKIIDRRISELPVYSSLTP